MTTVRMPVRVRVEVTEDRVDDDLVWLVTDAVDAALGRAVDRALTVRLVGDAPDRPTASSTICFTGDPLPGRVAGALEESLLTSVDLAVARLSRRASVSGADEVASDVGEPLDEDRVVFGTAGDAYLVPYYDEYGGPISMRLQGLTPARGRPLARRRRDGCADSRTATRCGPRSYGAPVAHRRPRSPSSERRRTARVPSWRSSTWTAPACGWRV